MKTKTKIGEKKKIKLKNQKLTLVNGFNLV